MTWYSSPITYLYISIILSLITLGIEIYITTEKEKLVEENKFKKFTIISKSLFLCSIIILGISFINFSQEFHHKKNIFSIGFLMLLVVLISIVCLWIADTVY